MGSSNYGKGDTSRSGLRGDMKGGGYQASGTAPKSAPGKTKNLAGSTSIASAPTTASGKVNSAFAENRGRQPAWGSMSLTSRMTKHQTAPYVPGDYAAYRKTLPGFVATAKGKKPAAPVVAAVVKPAAQVIRTTVGERLSPVKAAPPANKAVSARTGNTTGVTTGKTTGSKSFTPGMATKTMQSAYGRQMTNAMNRGNQPAGPMGGGGRAGGGGTRGSGSLSGGGSGSRSVGTSRTGGTRSNDPVRG